MQTKLEQTGRKQVNCFTENSLQSKLHLEANASGITLVALVVTIIVLLILAGISINLVAGSNGILGKATKAVSVTNEKALEERVELAMAELQMDYYTDGAQETSFADYLVNTVQQYKLSSGETLHFSTGLGDGYVKVDAVVNGELKLSLGWNLGTNAFEILESDGVDKFGPTISVTASTTNSITFTLMDGKGVAGYFVSPTKIDDVESISWNTTDKGTTCEGSATGLNAQTTYYIYAIDINNNVSSIAYLTKNFAQITHSHEWSADGLTATVTVTSSTENVKYYVGDTASTNISDYAAYTAPVTVNSGKIICFVRDDGTNNTSSSPVTLGIYKESKVTYDKNGITEATGLPETKVVQHTKAVDISAKLTDSHGSTFLGWSTNKNATTADSTITMTSSDMTVYAVWTLSQSCNAEHPEKHIPTGFHWKEGTKADGYVITDGTNEFVWIPVASNAAYSKKLGTNNWYLKAGSTGTDTAAALGSISNAVKGDKIGLTNIVGTAVNGGSIADRPEAAVVNKAGGFWVGRYEAGTDSVARGQNQWIAGVESASNDKSAEANAYWASKPISVKAGNEPARVITQSKALERANGWKSGAANVAAGTVAFQSGLITGAQWDAMCNFIGWNTCDTDCRTWGNYGNVKSKTYSSLTHATDIRSDWFTENNVTKKDDYTNRWIFPTGVFETAAGRNTAQKNIYDVAGNVWEWTTEVPQYANGANAVLRGGSAVSDGSVHVASCRGGHTSATTVTNWDVGFRLVLYVQ